VAREVQLREVVQTLRAAGGFPSGLDGRQEQPDEDPDDRDHDEQFDERETAAGDSPPWNVASGGRMIVKG
jgi:hypothetical protein